jgi:ATP-dependent DNA helicase RecG
MTGRPEPLWPLFGDLAGLPGIGPRTAEMLRQGGIDSPRDLIFTLPTAGIDRRRRASVREVEAPAVVTVMVTVGAHQPARAKGRPYLVTVDDGQVAFQLVYFHVKGDYLQRLLPTGQRRLISGKVELYDGIARMIHPDHVLPPEDEATLPLFEPVYPLTGTLTQKVMGKAVQGALARVPPAPEWIDPGLMAREGWPAWPAALSMAHAPGALADLLPTAPARARLAYDELLAHQLTLALARAQARRPKGRATVATGRLTAQVLAALPYQPTAAQTRAVAEITADMAQPQRMNRLLQGDVGSGKTLVAFLALLAAVEAGGQGALMAPTEILARQHLEGLRDLAALAGVRLDILTGRDRGPERAAKLAALADGALQILVGTHAVFQREVLVMTATPIPRSLALAQYGDMDVSVLDEKPPGRTPVRTAVMSADRIGEVVDHLRRAVADGRQAYWVCPLVEESEATDLTAAEERFKRLRAALGEGVVGLVHGQLPPADKDAAMARFQQGETRVLVATTVIEVGVNVPNASIMVIERAETFGLAQLHQLRGRVGRGAAQSTCLMLYQPPLSEGGRRRLDILRQTEDGFRIAEEDLAMRGAGDMIGTAQSGLPRFRIADLERQAGLMAVAQTDARKLLSDDPTLATPRGQAARLLLWLMEQDKAIRLISVG